MVCFGRGDTIIYFCLVHFCFPHCTSFSALHKWIKFFSLIFYTEIYYTEIDSHHRNTEGFKIRQPWIINPASLLWAVFLCTGHLTSLNLSFLTHKMGRMPPPHSGWKDAMSKVTWTRLAYSRWRCCCYFCNIAILSSFLHPVFIENAPSQAHFIKPGSVISTWCIIFPAAITSGNKVL